MSGQCRPTVCNADPPSAMPVARIRATMPVDMVASVFLQKTQDRQCHGWANKGEAS